MDARRFPEQTAVGATRPFDEAPERSVEECVPTKTRFNRWCGPNPCAGEPRNRLLAAKGGPKTSSHLRRVTFPCVRTTNRHPRDTLQRRKSSTPFGMAFGSPPSKETEAPKRPATRCGSPWPRQNGQRPMAAPLRRLASTHAHAVARDGRAMPSTTWPSGSLNLETSIQGGSKMGEEPFHRVRACGPKQADARRLSPPTRSHRKLPQERAASQV